MKKLIILFLIITGTLFASSLDWESDLVFSHKFHIEDVEAECFDCHEGVKESTMGTDDLLPVEETCLSCHEKEDMDCEDCHTQGKTPVILPRVKKYSEKFNHKTHLENDISCEDCHAEIANKDEVTSGVHLPEMDKCMTCHETPDDMDGCYTCHTQEETLIPQDHIASWKTEHGLYSESETTCQNCHTESYCIDCHQGENTMSQSHPADFIITHGMNYLVRETDCESCHESVDYCIECHMDINYVIPVSHNMEDWNGQLHAEEARINFESCSVCHVAGEDRCIECHN